MKKNKPSFFERLTGAVNVEEESEKLDILKHNGFSCHEGGTIIAAKRVE